MIARMETKGDGGDGFGELYTFKYMKSSENVPK